MSRMIRREGEGKRESEREDRVTVSKLREAREKFTTMTLMGYMVSHVLAVVVRGKRHHLPSNHRPPVPQRTMEM